MASAGTVTLDLDANSVKLIRELQKAEKRTKRTARQMQGNFARSFQAIGRAASTLGIAFSGVFTAQTIRNISEVGRRFESLERSLAVTAGGAVEGAKAFEFIGNTAQDLGLDLQSAAGAYSTLAAATQGTVLAGQATRDIFLGASQASRALGLSAADTAGILRAFGQIAAKGKVSTEELLQIAERGIPAFELFSTALGKSKTELFQLLQQGKIASDTTLPLVADALTNQFAAAAAEAASDTESSFNRLGNAIDRLKNRIADSGLNEALANLADNIRIAIGGATLAEQILDVRQQIERLKSGLGRGVGGGALGLGGGLDASGSQLRALREELLRLLKLQSEQAQSSREGSVELINVASSASKARARLAEYNEEASRLINEANEKLSRSARSIINATNTPIENFIERMQEARRVLEAGLISEERFERFRQMLLDDIISPIDDIPGKIEQSSEAFDDLQTAAEQAARNIQDAFADFLFDPFEDGLRGMVRGFLDAIRRMVANQAAIQLFGFIKSAFRGDGLSLIDLGSLPQPRAAGGPVTSGDPFIVGEKGPELFVPSQSGVVLPNHEMRSSSGVVVNNTINVNGADPARTAELLAPLLAENREQTKAELMRLRDQGRF